MSGRMAWRFTIFPIFPIKRNRLTTSRSSHERSTPKLPVRWCMLHSEEGKKRKCTLRKRQASKMNMHHEKIWPRNGKCRKVVRRGWEEKSAKGNPQTKPCITKNPDRIVQKVAFTGWGFTSSHSWNVRFIEEILLNPMVFVKATDWQTPKSALTPPINESQVENACCAWMTPPKNKNHTYYL